jgi:hypothetical protein
VQRARLGRDFNRRTRPLHGRQRYSVSKGGIFLACAAARDTRVAAPIRAATCRRVGDAAAEPLRAAA